MADLKTKPTQVSVNAFLDSVADADKRADAYTLLEMMQEITGESPNMWGPSMVGFGTFHYVYASGHEGDIFLTGFSPRKNALSLYLMAGLDPRFKALHKKLGKCKASKGCLYIKKLADVDLAVLREIIQVNITYLNDTVCAAKQALAKKPAAKKAKQTRNK